MMLRLLLLPFTVTYMWFISIRNLFYDLGVFKTNRLPCFVISVGNLTVGGTGKTPTIIALAKLLQEKGRSVSILSRGYKRKTRGTVIVSGGENMSKSWEDVGDEPFLIAKHLPGVPVVVDSNRFRGGGVIVDKFRPDILLLDDAYQHRALHRDLNILLVSSQFGRYDDIIFPAGNLREPKSQTKRADLIFFSKLNVFPISKKHTIGFIKFNIPTFNTTLETNPALQCTTNVETTIKNISGKRVLAVSALGSPKGFERTLFETNAIITDHLIFRDHHAYTNEDVEKIIRRKKDTNSEFVITTDKDFIKLNNLVLDRFVLFSLSVNIVIPHEAEAYILSKIETSFK